VAAAGVPREPCDPAGAPPPAQARTRRSSGSPRLVRRPFRRVGRDVGANGSMSTPIREKFATDCERRHARGSVVDARGEMCGDPRGYAFVPRALLRSCSTCGTARRRRDAPRSGALPTDLRWFCKRSASTLGGPTDARRADRRLGGAGPQISAQPRGSSRACRVLWVDDNPANNEYERSLSRPDGTIFRQCGSTAEAIE
jgi:hypothetical protein